MPTSKNKQIGKILNKVYDQVIRTSGKTPEGKKDIVIFVGGAFKYTAELLKKAARQQKKPIRLMLLYDKKKKFKGRSFEVLSETFDFMVPCNLSSDTSIQKALLPYQGELQAITCRLDQYMPLFANVIPNVPYLSTPTAKSLHWASDKILMRRRLRAHNKSITPTFTVIKDNSKQSINKAIEKVGFPLVVKPSGLAASRLVTQCFHKEELEKVLKKVFKKINGVYREHNVSSEPQVLIEQFMEGQMYSIDGYVTKRGKVTFCPLVSVKTGKQIGFDDFFGYQQMTPTQLSKESILTAEYVAREAIHALGLRSTSAHVELLKTEKGWKVIELAARLGGFRTYMYEYSFGFNHSYNDVLIRTPEKITIPKKVKGYTVAMKFFARHEGYITRVTGIKKIQDLKSFKRITINKSVGDNCTFAKHGGSSVFNLIMFNKDRSKLLADIRRVEQMISIETSKENGAKNKK